MSGQYAKRGREIIKIFQSLLVRLVVVVLVMFAFEAGAEVVLLPKESGVEVDNVYSQWRTVSVGSMLAD